MSDPEVMVTEVDDKPFRLRGWMSLSVIGLAFIVRVFAVGRAANAIDDANMHVLNGLLYGKTGFLGPDCWWTPPFKHLVTWLFTAVFGNDEIGWRVKGVFFGTLAVYAAFLLARRAFRSVAPAFVAAILLALDPYSVAMSHTTFEDLPTTVLLLFGLLFFLRGVDGESVWDWLISAVCFGAAVGMRWWAGFALTAVLVGAMWIRRGDRIRVASAAVTFIAAPVAVYLAAYLPWISRGYSLPEWFLLQYDALRVQGSELDLAMSELTRYAGAWKWFLVWTGGGGQASNGAPAVSILMNDPVIWIFFVPSALLLCWHAYRMRRPEWLVVSISFLLTYAFFLVSPRAIYLYSATAVVPLGFVLLGYGVVHTLKRRWAVAVGLASLWSVYLLPLVGGRISLPFLYQWITRLVAG